MDLVPRSSPKNVIPQATDMALTRWSSRSGLEIMLWVFYCRSCQASLSRMPQTLGIIWIPSAGYNCKTTSSGYRGTTIDNIYAHSFFGVTSHNKKPCPRSIEISSNTTEYGNR